MDNCSVCRGSRWLSTLIALTVLGAAGACSADRPSTGAAPSAGPPATPSRLPAGSVLLALLADDRLVAVAPRTGAVVRQTVLPAATAGQTGHLLAVDPTGRQAYALIPRQPAAPDQLAVIETRTLSQPSTVPLDPGTHYRSLAVGERTGRLFLFGNRSDATGESAWVSVLDADRRHVGSWMLRPANGHRWTVYSGSVAPDERHLAVSYHGADTTGADVVTSAGAGWSPCGTATSKSGAGCSSDVHGRVVAAAGGVFASTGDGDRMLLLDYGGRIVRSWDPALPRNHLMEFDVAAGTVLVVGPCTYSGGLTELTTGTGKVTALARPGPPGMTGEQRLAAGTICGERVTRTSDGTIAVSPSPEPTPREDAGQLLLLPPGHGQLTRTMLPADVVDLLPVTVDS